MTATSEQVARAAARSRHPSVRWTPPAGALRHRLARRLAAAGAPHPEIAAAVLEARGRAETDIVDFAAALGVDVELVARAEAGLLGAAQLPDGVRALLARPG